MPRSPQGPDSTELTLGPDEAPTFAAAATTGVTTPKKAPPELPSQSIGGAAASSTSDEVPGLAPVGKAKLPSAGEAPPAELPAVAKCLPGSRGNPLPPPPAAQGPRSPDEAERFAGQIVQVNMCVPLCHAPRNSAVLIRDSPAYDINFGTMVTDDRLHALTSKIRNK